MTTEMSLESLAWIFGRGFSENTLRNYHRHLSKVLAWLESKELTLADLTDENLAAFLDSQHAAGLTPSNGTLALAAIGASHREDGTPSPVGPKSRGALREWRRNSAGRGRGQAGSLPWEKTDLIVAFAEADGNLRGLRDAALIATMSDALLRGSEAAALNCQDIKINADATGSLIVQRSKTDDGPSLPQFLGESTIARIVAWQFAGNIHTGPLFRAIRRGDKNVGKEPLTRSAISLIIKRRAAAVGIKETVSSHSPRIGSAGSLAGRGAGIPELQAAGRWKDSRMPAVYAGPELAKRSATARLRYQK